MSSRVRGATSWLVAINVALALLLAALWLAPGAPAAWRNWQPAAPQAPALDDVRAATLVANAAATAAVAASRNASPAGFSCAGKHLCRQMQRQRAQHYIARHNISRI